MSDYYNRSTRECSFKQLRPEIVNSFRSFVQERGWEDVEPEIQACCETTSEQKKKGFLGRLLGGDPDPVNYMGMFFTPTMLFWVRAGPQSGVVVAWAKLRDVEVRNLSLPMGNESGLEVFGFIGESSQRVHAYIGLGAESAAQRFREAAKAAAQAAK